MATPFKSTKVRSMTGFLDLRRSPDEVGLNNFTMLLNTSVRGRGKRCRRGGWQRLLKDVNHDYNNEDLHDQLIGLSFYYEPLQQNVFIPGGITGFGYPYFIPSKTTHPTLNDEFFDFMCGYAPDFADQYPFPEESGYFIDEFFFGYPYEFIDEGLDGCDSGHPFYYPLSYFELRYGEVTPGSSTTGYAYGEPFPIISDPVAYLYEYCGTTKIQRGGCNEAITLVTTVGDVEGQQHLMVATKSRIYSFNQSFGNWSIIADGLGTRVDDLADCSGCSQERLMSANLDNTVIFVNGINRVIAHNTLSPPSGCNVWRAEEIEDLITLNVSSAAVVGAWKGFIFLGDIQQDGFRYRNRLIWSDFNDPLSYIPDDDSLAGFQDLGNDETILRIEPLNDYLFIFTDKSIYRGMLIDVGGTVTFSFEELYRGQDALRFKYSLVNTGDAIFYWTNSRLVGFTSLDKRPIEPEWLRAFSGSLFDGVEHADLSFDPINIDKCNLFVGGWNPNTKEIWWSWPTGDSQCPDMTLVVNMIPNEEGADFVDHGFTAFAHWDGRIGRTLLGYLEELEICPREELLPDSVKEGAPIDSVSPAFENPAEYLWNSQNDWNAPSGPASACSKLEQLWIDTICTECKNLTRFVMADGSDKTLKEYQDDLYSRERLVEGIYELSGYSTVIQSGSEDFGVTEDKMVDMLNVTYTAEPQTTPNLLYAHIGLSQQPECRRWDPIRFYDEEGDLKEGRELRCLTDKDSTEHTTDHTRDDLDAKFPTQGRAKFLAYRLTVNGTGGGSCFSGVELKVARDEDY